MAVNIKKDNGYIQIYTGSGKGKTTAAVGVTVRAVSAGLKVFFGQFMKKNFSSEHKYFEENSTQITHELFGSGSFIRNKPSSDDVALATKGLEFCKSAIQSNEYDVCVLDEICVAVHLGLVSEKEVIEALRSKPKSVEIILTGRYATKALIDEADLVSEMRQIKHYYEKGVPARVGIEE